MFSYRLATSSHLDSGEEVAGNKVECSIRHHDPGQRLPWHPRICPGPRLRKMTTVAGKKKHISSPLLLTTPKVFFILEKGKK